MKQRESKARRYYAAFAFLIPLMLTTASFAAAGVTPFGEKSLAVSDALGYYLPFLSYCKSILHGEHSILYSFSQDLGSGIAATLWPYLANPFSWLIALFEYEQYPMGYSIGVILMDSLYGLAMYLFVADKYGNRLSGLLVSTVYALCGFNVVFNINTVFFCGGPLFLPLMALGQRKLLRGESPILYAVSITYSLILQLQMGFAICLASVFFFFAECWLKKGVFRRFWLRYLLVSIFGGMLGAFVWIPEMMVLYNGRGALSITDFAFTANASLLDFGARFFTGANSVSQIADGYPAVFCGILPVALSVLFFMDKQIERRKKTTYAAMLMIYTFAFYIRFFTSIFQGFTHANWFNYRFSYIFTFLMMCMSMEELERIEQITIKQAVTAGLGILLLSLLIFFKAYEFVDGVMPVLDLALLAIMGGGFWLYKTKPEKAPKKVLIILFCLCTFLQLYLNNYFCTKKVLSVWKYDDGEYFELIMKKAPPISGIQAADPGFYRIESESKLQGSNGNDSLFLGYNGVGYAGHTERSFVSVGLGKLGIDFYSGCWNSYDSGTPSALDSLLGIKYVLSDRDLSKEKGYSEKLSMFGETLYENPDVLPIVFVSEETIVDVVLEDFNAFNNLNAIWRAAAGDNRDIFTEETDITFSNHNPTDTVMMSYSDVDRLPIGREKENSYGEKTDGSISNSYIEFAFVAGKTGPIYLYDSSSIIKDYGSAEDVLQYVGFYQAGEEVSGKLILNYTVTDQIMAETIKRLHICYADANLLKEYSERIRSRGITVFKESDSQLSGDVTLEENQRLLFTIPFDEGWKLTIDGVEVPLEKTADLFMSASIQAGKHRYRMDYWPVGLSIGIADSLMSLLALILLSVFIRLHRKEQVDNCSEACADSGATAMDSVPEKAKGTA